MNFENNDKKLLPPGEIWEITKEEINRVISQATDLSIAEKSQELDKICGLIHSCLSVDQDDHEETVAYLVDHLPKLCQALEVEKWPEDLVRFYLLIFDSDRNGIETSLEHSDYQLIKILGDRVIRYTIIRISKEIFGKLHSNFKASDRAIYN